MHVCKSLQTRNHTSTPPLGFFTGRMSFLPLNQQRQGTEVVENDATGSVAEDGREGAMSKSPSAGADKFKDLVKKHGAAFHVAGMLKATRDERPEKALVPAPRSQLVSFVLRLLNCQ